MPGVRAKSILADRGELLCQHHRNVQKLTLIRNGIRMQFCVAGQFRSFQMACHRHNIHRVSVETCLGGRMDTYFAGFDIIYAGEKPADISGMVKYKKKRIPAGFVRSEDILPSGTDALIRTLNGDIPVTVSGDTYIMLGVSGDIYPISREKFENTYEVISGTFELSTSYAPTAKDERTGQIHSLLEHAQTCICKSDTFIHAKPIEKAVKVFPLWDDERYLLGKKGDFLAVRPDDLSDIYVIEKNIFGRLYEAAF